jgi:hypothetical protein
MQNMLMGPTWGIVAVAVVVGVVTTGCFIAMFKYLVHPGENRPDHPKYSILRRDR